MPLMHAGVLLQDRGAADLLPADGQNCMYTYIFTPRLKLPLNLD